MKHKSDLFSMILQVGLVKSVNKTEIPPILKNSKCGREFSFEGPFLQRIVENRVDFDWSEDMTLAFNY